MSAPAPLRHYYVAPEDGRTPTCLHGLGVGGACSRPESDPVHLKPGDDTGYHDAIRAASTGAAARTLEQDDRAVRRAAARTARRHARYTFGTLRESPRVPREAG